MVAAVQPGIEVGLQGLDALTVWFTEAATAAWRPAPEAVPQPAAAHRAQFVHRQRCAWTDEVGGSAKA